MPSGSEAGFKLAYAAHCKAVKERVAVRFIGVSSLLEALPIAFPEGYRRWKDEQGQEEEQQEQKRDGPKREGAEDKKAKKKKKKNSQVGGEEKEGGGEGGEKGKTTKQKNRT